MSSPGYVRVPPDSSGKRVETIEILNDDNVLVQREVVALADASSPDAIAAVLATTPVGTEYGVAIRQVSGDPNVLVPFAYDHIDLSYSGSDVVGVVYKSGGTTVATLTLGYSSPGVLTSVARS